MNMNRHVVSTRQRLGSACLRSCRKLFAQIATTKARIHEQFRARLGENDRLLRLVLNEAEAVAWETEFPHLFFPTLAVEMARTAARWQERQISMTKRSASDVG
jgi:hypothetical protein